MLPKPVPPATTVMTEGAGSLATPLSITTFAVVGGTDLGSSLPPRKLDMDISFDWHLLEQL